MAESSTRLTLHSAVGRASAESALSPTLLSRLVSTGTLFCRFRRLIAILVPLLADGLELDPRVVHPVVEDPRQDPDEAVGDDVEVPQGEVALIQLAVHEDAVDELLDRPLDPCRGRVRQGAGRRPPCVAPP